MQINDRQTNDRQENGRSARRAGSGGCALRVRAALLLLLAAGLVAGCRPQDDGPDAIAAGLLRGGARYVGTCSDPSDPNGSGTLDIQFPADILGDLGYGTLTSPAGDKYYIDVKPLQYPLRLAINIRAKEDWLLLGRVEIGSNGHLRGTLAKSFKNKPDGLVAIDLTKVN